MRTLIAMTAAAALLAGCGEEEGLGSGPEGAVRDYLSSLDAGDGRGLCALYSKEYRRLIKRERGSCVAADSQRDQSQLLRVQTDGDKATATVTCEDPTASDCSLPLVREDGRWRIDGSLSPND